MDDARFYPPSLETTRAFVVAAHDGQFTKGGELYWTHPFEVARILRARWPDTTCLNDEFAALLHDVVEDTPFTLDIIGGIWGPEVRRTVQLVTRVPAAETYWQYIERIRASGHVPAIRVKVADLLHNTDPERLERAGLQSMADRYSSALAILEGCIRG